MNLTHHPYPPTHRISSTVTRGGAGFHPVDWRFYLDAVRVGKNTTSTANPAWNRTIRIMGITGTIRPTRITPTTRPSGSPLQPSHPGQTLQSAQSLQPDFPPVVNLITPNRGVPIMTILRVVGYFLVMTVVTIMRPGSRGCRQIDYIAPPAPSN